MKYCFKDCVNVQLGDMVELCDVKVEVTESLVKNNPELFVEFDDYIPEYFKCIQANNDNYDFTIGKIYKNHNPFTYPEGLSIYDDRGKYGFVRRWDDKTKDNVGYSLFKPLTESEAKKYEFDLKCEDFLKQAYEKFPIGCKVNNLNISSYNYNFTILNHDFNILNVSSNYSSIRIFTKLGSTDVNDGTFCIFNELGWAEVKSVPLFKTENGVHIYRNDKFYAVHISALSINSFRAKGNPDSDNEYFTSNNVIFSTRELADEYIKKNKKTLKYYEDLILEKLPYGILSDDKITPYKKFYEILKSEEPKLYWLKVLQTIADDLNGDWKKSDTRDEKFMIGKKERSAGWESTSIKHTTVTYSDIYFKSDYIAQKAMGIMDDKLKEIYK